VARVAHTEGVPDEVSGEPRFVGIEMRPRLARVSLRSLARIAFAMWTCAAVVLVVSVLLTWEVLGALGVTTNVQSLARQLTNDSSFEVATGAIVAWTLLGAISFTLLATAVTVGLAALFNAITRLIGGVALDVHRADAPSRRRT
jgi:transmembrane protein DUF3566